MWYGPPDLPRGVSGRRADRRSARRPLTPRGRSTRRPLAPRGKSGPYHVTTQFFFLSHDVKNTKFNQYLPVDLTSLNVSNSRFRKPGMFWRWRHHGVALWRHGHGARHNCLLLTTARNVNCWADVANHVTRLWQAGYFLWIYWSNLRESYDW